MVTTPVSAQLIIEEGLESESSESVIESLKKDTSIPDAKAINNAYRQGSDLNSPKINIHILGDVKSPGAYKVTISDRAADVLKLAQLNRETTRVIQVRHPGEKTRYYDLYRYYHFGQLSHNPHLKEGDVVFISKPTGAVQISGPVKRPGIYELFGEKKLAQIIELSGGFSKAYAKNFPLKVIRFEDDGNKKVIDVEGKRRNLRRFRIEKGDTIIVPDIINARSKFDYSVESLPGENLVYPTSKPEIFVIGAVRKPGPYAYKSNLYVKDYIGFAGAITNSKLRHVVVLRDGKKKRLKLNDRVQAGDVMIVKEKDIRTFVRVLGIASTLLSVTLSAVVLADRL